MIKIIISCLIVATIVAGIWSLDIMSDRRNELEVMTPINLLEKPPQSYPRENRSVGVIKTGEKVKVLRMGYGKDFRAWKVKGSIGQEGWLVEEKGNVKVISMSNNK